MGIVQVYQTNIPYLGTYGWRVYRKTSILGIVAQLEKEGGHDAGWAHTSGAEDHWIQKASWERVQHITTPVASGINLTDPPIYLLQYSLESKLSI